jgi:ABC-type multidrug transport system ATPase subunit
LGNYWWCAARACGPDGGQARVLGLDARQDREELHERPGVQLQLGALPPKLKVGDAVELHASFYERPVDAAVLLQKLRLDAMRGSYWKALSGGQEQRLSIVLALIGQGRVVALGEPSHLTEQAATATRVRLRAPGQWMLQREGRRRTSSSSSPSASISASTP